MRKTYIIVAIALVLATAAWTVGASALLCKMSGRMDQFVFPWANWWKCLDWFGANWWATIIVVVSAAAPTVALVLLGIAAKIVHGFFRSSQAVYGETSFATPEQMRQGGIKLKGRPF